MKKLLLIAFLLSAVGLHAQSKTTGVVNLLAGMTAKLDLNNTTSTATLTFTGPSDRWYALQFGSFAAGGGMGAGQDIVYFNGTTLVDAVHNGLGATPSNDGTNNWTVTSNTVAAGTRTIVATRAFNTGDTNDYTFVYANADIDFAYSRSATASFSLAYHQNNRGYAMNKPFSCTPPSNPTAAAQAFCSGATVSNLIATGAAGAEFNWYANSAGGSELAGITVLTSTTYYVSQTVDACESARVPVAVTINTVANPTTDTTQDFCPGATVADLQATGTGTISWYNVPSGGSPLTGATALVAGNYYVSQTSGICTSARVQVAVTINSVATPTATAVQQVCTDSTISDLSATGTGTINWYNVSVGGTPLAGTTAITAGNYYVSQTVGTCESARVEVAVSFITVPVPTTDDDTQDFCGGSNVFNLSATAVEGASIQWFAENTGGAALDGYTILVDGTTYYAEQNLGGCTSERLPVTVTVNTIALPTTTDDTQAFCAGSTLADLNFSSIADAPVNLRNTPGGEILPVTTEMENGAVYNVSQIVDGCESAPLQITVTINPIPAVPDGDETQEFTAGQTIADLEISVLIGATVTWYMLDDEGDMIEVPSTTPLVDGEMYHVTQTLNNCESEMLMILVDEALGTAGFDLKNLMAYPNPVGDILTINNNTDLSEIAVYNLLGQKLISQKAEDEEARVNVSGLSAGSYTVKVITATGASAALKIMKQ